MKHYRYGKRLRGFAPLCQPMAGLVSVEAGFGSYHCVLVYKRKLTDEEVRNYDLDYLEAQDETTTVQR